MDSGLVAMVKLRRIIQRSVQLFLKNNPNDDEKQPGIVY